MAFCANCGASVADGAGFCAGCGKPVGAGAQPAAATSTGAAIQSAPATAQSSAMSSNVAAALAYVLGFITGIVFLVLEPYKHDRFVRFHAMQSILYSAAGIVFRIGWGLLVDALMTVTVWAGLVLVPVGLVISIGLFGFWIFLMYQ